MGCVLRILHDVHVWHTCWGDECAGIDFATPAIAKKPIFPFTAGFASTECHILVVQSDFEGRLGRLVAWCFGGEIVYTVVFGSRGLLLLVDGIFLVGPCREHDAVVFI